MQILIHAGMQKTGSSALQEHLALHRDELRQIGVIYPQIGDDRGHWRVSAAVNHEFADRAGSYIARRVGQRSAERMGERSLRMLREVLEAARWDELVILSHESFSNLKYATGLDAFLKEHGVLDEAVHMLAYARRPTEFYPSGIQQALKSFKVETPPPSGWTYPHLRRAEAIRKLFGGRSTLRAHNRAALVDGDIVADFNQFVKARYGRTLPPSTGESGTNISYSGPACAILQRARTMPEQVDGDDYLLIKHRIIAFDRTRPRVPLTLPPAWRNRISAEHAESWNGLLEQMSYPPEIADALRLEPCAPGPLVSRREVRDWLLSHHDPAYLRALIEWSASERDKGPAKTERAAELLTRIERRFDRRERKRDTAAAAPGRQAA